MVGNKRNARLDLLDDELSDWPGSQREQGAWVRFTEDKPAKRLSVLELDTPSEPSRRPEDDWFLGAYRRYHSGAEQKEKEKTREDREEEKILALEKLLGSPPPQDLPYEEQVTVAMFARRPRQAQRSGPTREELYREAQKLGIEGRSKMNKQELAKALGTRAQSR
jgi:hypothetical protein